MAHQRAARRRRRASNPPQPAAAASDSAEAHLTLARPADQDPDPNPAHDRVRHLGPTNAAIDREVEQARRTHRTALAAACSVVLVGVGCALALYVGLHGIETDRFARAWHALCEQNVRLLDAAFNQRLASSAHNVAAYLYAVPDITEENLVMYANRSSFDKSILKSVSTNPVLTYDQLPQFEAQYGLQTWPKPLPPENAVLVHDRPIVSPVLYIYPVAFKPSLQAFNQMSLASRRDGILALLRSPTKQIAMSGPLSLIPDSHRGFLIWVRALPRPTVDQMTPFVDWMSTVTVEFTTILTVALGTRASPQGVYMDIVHPTGELIFSTVPSNATRHPLHGATRYYTFPVLDQTWTARCLASRRFQHSIVTFWPVAIALITAAVFAVAGEATRRAVLHWHAGQRTLHQYAGQEELLAMLARSGRGVLEALPDALLVLNARGRILGINAAAVTLTGYSIAALEHLPVTQILAPHNACLPDSGTLPAGQFDGTVWHASGTAIPVATSVKDMGDATTRVADAVAAGVTALGSSTSHRPAAAGADAIAQVVLFHDISDQADAQRALEEAHADHARATQTRAALLTSLALLLAPQTRFVNDAMHTVEAEFRDTGRRPPPQRAGVCGVAWAADAADDVDAGVVAAEHMATLRSDLALLMDVPAVPLDGGSVHGVRLSDLIQEALTGRKRTIAGKRIVVLASAHPVGVRLAGLDLVPVRVLIAKMILIGSSAAADGAQWTVRYTVAHGRLILHQELSALSACVDLGGLDDVGRQHASLDDVGLQHASLGSDFGALPITYIALIRYVLRHEGTFARSMDAETGIALHVEVPLANLGVQAIIPVERR
ncbi:hypothetical protein GGF32_008857 [Allomyces javanicus]|nr:hypothetical protein GGF32_008857 [Allomyces javanicus]